MVLKYIFDRLVALIGLLVLWPVLLIVAVLVYVSDEDVHYIVDTIKDAIVD